VPRRSREDDCHAGVVAIGGGRRRRVRLLLVVCGLILLPACLFAGDPVAGDLSPTDLSPMEQLGKELFFDKNLSSPAGQSCASCHAPEVGFTGPDPAINKATGIYPGAVPERFGNRKPPSSAYASFSPKRQYDEQNGIWIGGQFWDGRTDDLVAQGKGPFLNPLEMNNGSAQEVVDKVRQSQYRGLFESVYGASSLNETDTAFDLIAQAIAAYESSDEVNPFSSKYDAYLAGRAKLTDQEQRGLELFAGKANCSSCHPHQKESDGSPPLFTNYTYHNVGTPRNPAHPFYHADPTVNPDGSKYRDLGLGAVLNDPAQAGKVKVPTLRNVSKKPNPQFVKAYLHNGVFKSVKDVVRFYNLRDVTRDKYLLPDVKANINRDDLGNLGLTSEEEDDIVAFLETLSDGYVPAPSPVLTPIQDPVQTPVRTVDAPKESPATTPPVTTYDPFRGVRDVIRVERFRNGFLVESSRQDGTRRR
jgi:cytochrome c peroxidase